MSRYVFISGDQIDAVKAAAGRLEGTIQAKEKKRDQDYREWQRKREANAKHREKRDDQYKREQEGEEIPKGEKVRYYEPYPNLGGQPAAVDLRFYAELGHLRDLLAAFEATR